MDVQCIVMYGVDKWCSYRILSLWFVKFLAHGCHVFERLVFQADGLVRQVPW